MSVIEGQPRSSTLLRETQQEANKLMSERSLQPLKSTDVSPTQPCRGAMSARPSHSLMCNDARAVHDTKGPMSMLGFLLMFSDESAVHAARNRRST